MRPHFLHRKLVNGVALFWLCLQLSALNVFRLHPLVQPDRTSDVGARQELMVGVTLTLERKEEIVNNGRSNTNTSDVGERQVLMVGVTLKLVM